MFLNTDYRLLDATCTHKPITSYCLILITGGPGSKLTATVYLLIQRHVATWWSANDS